MSKKDSTDSLVEIETLADPAPVDTRGNLGDRNGRTERARARKALSLEERRAACKKRKAAQRTFSKKAKEDRLSKKAAKS